MKGKGSISQNPPNRTRMIATALIIWQVVVFALAIWWGSLLIKQSKRIRELEGATGVSVELSETKYSRTERMLFWESSVFFILIFSSTGFLSWMYWRDLKRGRSIQAFFAGFTHELRTPLTSIRLQAESLAETARDVESKKLIERLLEDSLRLESQVDKTLELARVEGGGPVYTENFLIKPFLERLIRHWQDVYAGRITVSLEAEDLNVEADTAALQLIFRNLVENSIRHSKKEKIQIQIRIFPKNSKICVHFKDDGSEARVVDRELGKLFQKGPGSQGAGVGLYLVRVLMERMGGLVAFVPAADGFLVRLELEKGADHV